MNINDYLDLIPSFHADSINFKLYLTAILTQVSDLCDFIRTLLTDYDIESAEGLQLDAIGHIFNLYRTTGETDVQFLMLKIVPMILACAWKGTNESLVDLLHDCFPLHTYNDLCNGTVKVQSKFIPVPAGITKEII